MHVQEQVIVRVMERYVKVNTQNVIARPIMYGVVALAYVIVPLSIHVVVRDIVREVGHLVGANIKVVIVRHITVGMVVFVLIHTRILVRVGIQPRVRG